jgi:hypothetical protein
MNSNKDNTNKEYKPAASSLATTASTPGAVHVDVSSMKGQQAFQKTKDLTDGPKYFLEDDEKPVPSGLEQDSVSSKRDSGQSRNDKELKELGKPKKSMAIVNEKLKKGGTPRSWQRQENRRARIVSPTLREDAKPPSVSTAVGTVRKEGESSEEEEKQEIADSLSADALLLEAAAGAVDDYDSMDDDDRPGAVAVSGPGGSSSSANNHPPPLTTNNEDLKKEKSSQLLLEASLVEEGRGDVVEAMEVKPEAPPTAWQRYKYYVFGLACVATTVAIVLGVTLSSQENNEPLPIRPPIESPTLPPTETLSDFEFLRQLFLPISSEDALADPTSPQYQAMNWLADVDSFPINFQNTSTHSILTERYVLVVLYFSTGGPHWNDNLNFLSNYSICEWPNIGEDESLATTTNEVDCVDGSVVKITIGN